MDAAPEGGCGVPSHVIKGEKGGGQRRQEEAPVLKVIADEVVAHIAAHASERDKSERRLVARHQHARPWQVITAAGVAVEAQAPRVNHILADPAADGHRESAESWAGLLPDCKQQWRARPAAGKARPSTGSTLKPIPSNPHSARSGLEPGSGHGRLGWPNSRRECLPGGRTRPSSRAAREQ